MSEEKVGYFIVAFLFFIFGELGYLSMKEAEMKMECRKVFSSRPVSEIQVICKI